MSMWKWCFINRPPLLKYLMKLLKMQRTSLCNLKWALYCFNGLTDLSRTVKGKENLGSLIIQMFLFVKSLCWSRRFKVTDKRHTNQHIYVTLSATKYNPFKKDIETSYHLNVPKRTTLVQIYIASIHQNCIHLILINFYLSDNATYFKTFNQSL